MAHAKYLKPDVLMFGTGRRWYHFAALPPFLAGICFVLYALIHATSLPRFHCEMLAFVGVVLGVTGAMMAYGRGVIVNRRKGRVTTWFILGGLRFTKTYPLDRFHSIEISRVEGRGGPSFPVVLCSDGSGRVLIDSPMLYGPAQAVAKKLAEVTGIAKIADASSGSEFVRSADEFAEPLRKRLAGETVELPPAPPNMRSSRQLAPGKIYLRIPPTGFLSSHYLTAAMFSLGAAGIGFLPVWLALTDPGLPERIKWFVGEVVLAGLAAAFLVGMLCMYPLAAMRYTVEVSPTRLRLRKRWAGRERTIDFPADKIKEIEVVDPLRHTSWWHVSHHVKGKAIFVASIDFSLTFGGGLSDAELAWLKAVIEKTLTA